jgi:hypothetical protein
MPGHAASSGSAKPAVTTPVATVSPATLLGRVTLEDGDLPGGLIVKVIPGGNQEIGVSNEVVVYDSAAQAAKALAQLRTSVTT